MKGMRKLVDRSAILTGSYVYGQPTPKSDVDLAIRVDEVTRDRLIELLGSGQGEHVYDEGTVNLRVGVLNLLISTKDADHEVWRKGTAALKKRAPVTRDEAKAHFDKLRGV
jgi:hypothetical protein